MSAGRTDGGVGAFGGCVTELLAGEAAEWIGDVLSDSYGVPCECDFRRKEVGFE